MQWFEVDKEGLRALLARRGKEFVIFELVSNAWDAPGTTAVSVRIERQTGSSFVDVIVEDDSPDGFSDLTHAFTLFSPSGKKGDAELRGRFNFGEKIVLALCSEAEILSTKGGFRFDREGRHALRQRRPQGSVFRGRMRMTAAEVADCRKAFGTLIPPSHVLMSWTDGGDSFQLDQRCAPLATAQASLATEVADQDGLLRRTRRKTQVQFFEPADGETPMLYELGIPVTPTGDRWHINVLQKVPLTLERDNVPSAFLAHVRALAVEALQDRLTQADANSAWVRTAVQHHGQDLSQITVQKLASLRFGERRVSFDLADREANNLATAAGYVVVHGAQLSAEEWEIYRGAGAIKPAGQVTPSPKPYDPNGSPLRLIPRASWTEAMHDVANYASEIAWRLLNREIVVQIANERNWPFAATYGPSGVLCINYRGVGGRRWFEGPREPISDLLLHEFAHEYEGNHLSREYYKALTKLGAKLAEVALAEPELFERIGRQQLPPPQRAVRVQV